MPLDSAKFVITTTYGILSLIAYAVVNYVLLTNRKLFSGSFFKLFICQSVLNSITYLNSMVTLRLPQNTCGDCLLSPIFNQSNYTGLNIFHTVHFHMAFVQYLMTVVVSANRFTMMLFPFSFERHWRYWIYPIVSIVTIGPFLCTKDFLLNHSYYIYVPEMDWFAIKTTLDIADIYNILIIIMILVTSFSVLFNIATVCMLIFKSPQNRAKKSELYLIVHSFIGFAIEAFAATVTVVNRLAQSVQTSWYMQVGQLLLPFVSDGLTLISPFLLIMCSSALRCCLVRLVTRNKTEVVSIRTISNARADSKWSTSRFE